MYKPPSVKSPRLPNTSPGGLYSEIALKFKIKQSKICTVTHKFLHLPKNYYLSQMIAIKKVSQYIAVCVASLVVSRGRSSVHIDKNTCMVDQL